MLLLWDIDHTLVEMRSIGTEVFGRAFTAVTGVRMERQAAVDGMTGPHHPKCVHNAVS